MTRVNGHRQPSASTTAWGEDISHREDEPMNSGETGRAQDLSSGWSDGATSLTITSCLHLSKYERYFVHDEMQSRRMQAQSNEEHRTFSDSKFPRVIKAFIPPGSEGNDTRAKLQQGSVQ